MITMRYRLVCILAAELALAVVASSLVAACYWLKATYSPGPTATIITIGVALSAIVSALILQRYGKLVEGVQEIVACLLTSITIGILTLSLSIGFITNLLGS